MAASLRTHSSIKREHVGLILGVLASSMGLLGIVGPLGVGVALAAGFVTRVAGAPFGVGVLHLGAIASGSGPEILSLVLLESGAACFILADVDWFDDVSVFVALVVGAITLSVPVVFLAESDGVVMAASALVISVALLAYGLHRYERVRLGLVSEDSI